MHPHVETKGSIKTIPLITQLLRESANAITSPSLKISTYDTSGGLSKAEQLLEQDYGLIVVANHFSKGDPPRIIKFIFDNPQLQKRRILLPEAIHHGRVAQLAL